MGLLDWFCRPKHKTEAVGRTASRASAGIVDSSQPDTVFLNSKMDDRDLVLIGSNRSFAISGIILSTMLMVGRQCGWRGGRDFFDDSSKVAILYPFLSGVGLSDSDALSLASCLLDSINDATGEAADFAKSFIGFCSEGGFRVSFSPE